DPHETARIEELEDPGLQPETSLSPPRHASPSTPSPTDPPVIECDNAATLPTANMAAHWAKPGFLKNCYNLFSETVARADDLGYSVAAC
ncbi:hypothetical protein PQX77_002780, partial [Marasmius sp. AFHP31]